MKIWQSPTDSLFDAPLIGQSAAIEGEETKDDTVVLKTAEKAFYSMDSIKCLAFKKAVQSMKRGEKSRFTVSIEFKEENEDEGMDAFYEGTQWDATKPVVMDIELVKLVKVEDWYNDRTTIMRTLRKGKGRNPYTDSDIYFRLKIEVNGSQIFSNYPESDLPIEKMEDYKEMTIEQRQEHLQDPTLLHVKLDNYILPSLLQKLMKSLKKNQVVTMTTTKIKEKLHTNFKSEFLDQYEAFKEGDIVTFTVTLYGVENTSYFYRNPVAKKLEILQRIKATAGEFFKRGNCAKAAKIYQKVNGYFNFGDVVNNFSKEDDSTEAYKGSMDQLNALKLVCFTNLCVCKFKLQEYQSVVAITEQIIDFAPNHPKALFFRGKCQYLVEEFDPAIATLTKLCKQDPDNADFKAELDMAKKLKAQEIQK